MGQRGIGSNRAIEKQCKVVRSLISRVLSVKMKSSDTAPKSARMGSNYGGNTKEFKLIPV